ncbi:hypothetical protein ACKXGF_08735 [Alkalibacillus sp. S2W]|uniref:hypothetical protein n=1 Tax=Alkalibacillus sp. S2W TaxID=3386553 RepID=UPI00398CB7EF
MKTIYIHILNILAFIALIVFNLFAYLGMNFTPQNEPYIAEYTFLASFYFILALFYYLQLKQTSLKSLLVIIIVELLLLITWSHFGNTLLESLIE